MPALESRVKVMKIRIHKSEHSKFESLIQDFDAVFEALPRVGDWITTRSEADFHGSLLVESIEVLSNGPDGITAFVVVRHDPPPSGVLMGRSSGRPLTGRS